MDLAIIGGSDYKRWLHLRSSKSVVLFGLNFLEIQSGRNISKFSLAISVLTDLRFS